MTDLSQRFLFDPNARQIILNTGKVEIGQHVNSAFQKIVADSLEINRAAVRVSPVNTRFSPDDGLTVGSLSIQVTGTALRQAALALRTVLLEQAALGLKSDSQHILLDADTLEFYIAEHRCCMFDLQIARELSTANCLTFTMTHPVVDSDPLSSIAGSIRGERRYIQDLVLPGMLYARALRSRLLNLDNLQHAKVITDGGFSALITASEVALEAEWSRLKSPPETPLEKPLETPPEKPATARDASCDGPVELWIHQRQTLTQTTGDTRPIKAGVCQSATRAFLLHASIAPCCAIARFKQETLEVWTHSQGIFALRDTLAGYLGMRVEDIILHHVPSAGCYGHNAADDAVMDAVLACLQTHGAPVRVTWSRQDDFLHAPVGAPMHVQIAAKLAEDHSISHWRQTIWSGPHGQRPGSGGNINLLAAIEQDPQNQSTTIADLPDAIGGGARRNAIPPYAIQSLGITSHVVQDLPVRSSSIRGLGAHMNVVCIEATMDKLADSCAMDRVEFRLRHLIDPRAREVLGKLRATLEAAAVSLQDNEAIGIGYSRYKEKAAYAAVAARVRLTENVELLDVWAVVDAGRIVDRCGAHNQLEGGIIQAASWTLCEGALLRDGYIDAQGWEDYPIMGWSEIPAIHTTLLNEDTEQPYLGVGECMVGPVTAAIVNAVSTAAGCSMANLPLTTEKFIRAASMDTVTDMGSGMGSDG